MFLQNFIKKHCRLLRKCHTGQCILCPFMLFVVGSSSTHIVRIWSCCLLPQAVTKPPNQLSVNFNKCQPHSGTKERSNGIAKVRKSYGQSIQYFIRYLSVDQLLDRLTSWDLKVHHKSYLNNPLPFCVLLPGLSNM